MLLECGALVLISKSLYLSLSIYRNECGTLVSSSNRINKRADGTAWKKEQSISCCPRRSAQAQINKRTKVSTTRTSQSHIIRGANLSPIRQEKQSTFHKRHLFPCPTHQLFTSSFQQIKAINGIIFFFEMYLDQFLSQDDS